MELKGIIMFLVKIRASLMFELFKFIEKPWSYGSEKIEVEDGVLAPFSVFKFLSLFYIQWLLFYDRMYWPPQWQSKRVFTIRARVRIYGTPLLCFFWFILVWPFRNMFHIYFYQCMYITSHARGPVVFLLTCKLKGVGSTLTKAQNQFFITYFL